MTQRISVFILLSTLLSFPVQAAVEKGPYLIYEGNNTSMTVIWQMSSTQGCNIEWGTSTSYGMGSANTSEYGSDHQHQYTITGLNPATKYYYNVDCAGNGSFVTAPASSASNVKILAYGDTRSNPGDHNTVANRMINTYNSDADYQTIAILAGDWVNSGDNESDWTSQFFPRSYSGLMQFQSEVPLVGPKGNHEGTGNLFKKYFPFPYVNSFYWSFDYGPVHVAVIDQYTSYGIGSTQYNWLANDLANSDKEWKIITFHEPAWSAGGHSNDGTAQSAIQPLAVQYGADIIICGHNHYYARAVVDDVHHITSGGGGAPLYSPGSGSYLVKTSQSRHFLEMDFQGTTMNATVRHENGSVIETFSISHSGNDAPTADAGNDQTVTDSDESGSESITLDGSGSYDPDGSIVSYTWKENSSTIATGVSPTVSLGVGTHTITLEVEDDQMVTDTDTVVVTVFSGAGGEPVTVSSRINHGDDDAEENNSGGGMYLTSSDIELVYDGSTRGNQHVGLRFNNINIPQGVQIQEATIQFTVDETNTGTTNLTFRGEAVDNAARFTTASYNISSRPKTSASVNWSPAAWSSVGQAGADQKTPNLAAVVQEIVGRSGWSQGNSMVIFVDGTGERTAESYNGSSGSAALLSITYLTPGSGNDTPTADAGSDQTVTDTDNSGSETIYLDGTGSYDPDGSIVAYTWKEGSTTIATGATPNVDLGIGTHTITLTVEDNDGATATDNVVITVNEGSVANQDPIPDAGSDQTLTDSDLSGNEQVQLDGSVSYDPDGSIYTWIWKEGTTTIATGESPSVYLDVGTHTIVLTVTDNDGASADDTVVITVNSGAGGEPVTVTSRVNHGDDDGEQKISDGSMYLTSSDLELIYDSYVGGDQIVGIRFNGVDVPQGAQIQEATIQFTVDEADSGSTNLYITGQADDNGARFTSTAWDISSRTKTSSTTSWSPAAWGSVGASGDDQKTPNLATIVQEIVNRSGWSQGNSMVFFVEGSGERTAESYNGSSGSAPLLSITYIDGAPPVNQNPIADAGSNQSVTDSDDSGAESVTLDGSGSYDPDGSLTSFTWREGGSTIATGVSPAINLAVGTHNITLEIEDNQGATATDSVVVTVNAAPQNQAPVADAGSNQSVTDTDLSGSETVSLNGSGSTDPDGSIVSYTWREGGSTIATGASPNVNLAVGTHTIELTVEDNDGATDTDTVVITIEEGQSGGDPVTVSSRVSTGNDDAEQYQSGGRMYLNSSDLELVYDGSSKGNQYVGMRFNNMTIPQGATITNAYIQFTVDETNSGSTNLTIRGQDADNPGGFTTSRYNISGRSTTSASVNWSPAAWTSRGVAGADQRTPNLASVVQEIVNRSGWNSGNSMVMIITGSGERTAESYNGSSSQAPLLVVTYE